MTPTEAVSTIYAMRESIANGWKPNQDQELALALADMLDEANAYVNRYAWLKNNAYATICKFGGKFRVADSVRNIVLTDWVDSFDAAIDSARSNHEPF